MVWRRARFRLNIATHSLSSVREQSQKDLFLPLPDLVPQTGLSSMTLRIYRSREVLIAHNLPLFLVSLGSIFKTVSNVSLPSRPFPNCIDAPVSESSCPVPAKNQGKAQHSPISVFLLSKWVSGEGVCPLSLCVWDKAVVQEEAKQPLFLCFPGGGGICVPRGGGPGMASCFTETELAYPGSFLPRPSLDFREGRTQSPKALRVTTYK